MLADVFLTIQWREPLTSLYTDVQQGRLGSRLDGLSVKSSDELRRASARSGEAFGRLRAPAADVDLIFVSGTDDAALRKGPGHYPATSLPGEPGKVAIAAHRTSWSAPFRHLQRLTPGKEILIEMPYGVYLYEVTSQQTIAPDDMSVLASHRDQELLLTTCGLLSMEKRLAVKRHFESSFRRRRRGEPEKRPPRSWSVPDH